MTSVEAARLEALAQKVASAITALQPETCEADIEELLRALPGNPYVQQFARSAAVIRFQWPIERTAFESQPVEMPAPDNIDLVTFHAHLPRAPSGIHESIDYATVLALSLESARIKAPRARRILLTDETTHVPDSLPIHEVRRFPMDPSKLMYERMRAQETYLGERPADRYSILLDTDVVVNREPSTAFTGTFDVGLTWRPEFADAPFNGGVIFVGPGKGGSVFFALARTCYDALCADAQVSSRFPRDLREWWGDQYALAVTVGYREFAANRGTGVGVENSRVRFFPCTEYNFTAEPNVNYPTDVLRSKMFIHFKGNRKVMQARYLGLLRSGLV